MEFVQIFGLALLAGVKFLYGPTAVYLAGYSFWQAIIITSLGGFIGVFIFFKTGQFISDWWVNRFGISKKPKKKFSKKNRAFIKIRATYGLYGLAFVTPCIISIPFGCLLAAKYYPHDRLVFPLMFASVVFWSLVLTSITYLIGPIFK